MYIKLSGKVIFLYTTEEYGWIKVCCYNGIQWLNIDLFPGGLYLLSLLQDLGLDIWLKSTWMMDSLIVRKKLAWRILEKFCALPGLSLVKLLSCSAGFRGEIGKIPLFISHQERNGERRANKNCVRPNTNTLWLMQSCKMQCIFCSLINRPCVAGAVLQTPLQDIINHKP